MALLEIRKVTRRFGEYVAVRDVSISVESGEFFTLLGPSGCGKTTLLRMIAGFDQPDGGQILLDGQDLAELPAERRPIHTVFQSYALFPHLTVWDNVAFPLKMADIPPAQRKAQVAAMLDAVHLSDRAGHFPHELSGGQQQRVALARALVDQPRLLLLDEPLGALDRQLREEMQLELIKLQRAVGITFIFVTHDQSEALALSHRIAVMKDGDIEQLDEPSKIYGLPRTRFVADFIGNCNLLEATVTACRPDGLQLQVPALGAVEAPSNTAAQPSQHGVLALRPEQVHITPRPPAECTLNCFAGKVLDFLYVGDVTTYKVALDNGQAIQALLPNTAPGRAKFFELGDRVWISWAPEAGHYVPD